MKSLPALFLACLCLNFAYAQTVVSGKVTEEGNDIGIPGVTVAAKGSSASTITDVYGEFQLSVPEGTAALVFSSPGMLTKEVPLGSQTVFNTSLEPDNSVGSSDAVSIGFGEQSASELTSSIAQIKSDDISDAPVVDLEQANQGRASGIFIQNNSGKLGEGTSIRIRGGSSLSASNQPLYIVDGIPLASGSQNDINPANIESMEVLKDASASAIYGSRAANGVIIITTKSGKSGKMKIEADYQFGIGQTPKTLDLYTPQQYNQQVIEFTLRAISLDGEITRANLERWAAQGSSTIQLSGTDPSGIDEIRIPVLDSLTFNTDWQDEVFRNAISNRANVNISGGTDQFNYFGGLSFMDQEGILIGNDFQRLSGRLNLGSQITSALSVDLSLNYAGTKDNRLNDDQDLGSPLQAIVLPPSDSFDPNDAYRLRVRSLEYNPLTEINFADNIETGNSLIGNLNLKYDFTDQLSLNVQGGTDFFDSRIERRQGPETLEGAGTGLSRLTEITVTNNIFTGFLDYSTTVNDNRLSAVLGTSYQTSTTETAFRLARVNSISTLDGLSSTDASLQDVPIADSKFSFLSFFTRVNYNIDDKYIFQLSARADGSSRFSEDNRFGYFPALSAGWNIHNEDFFSSNTFGTLKLKASYGLIGTTPEEDFLYRLNYISVNYGIEDGIRVANLANADLKWETTAQTDIGLELGVLNDRITASVDYYLKQTEDLLFPVPVTQTSGFSAVLQNVGSMENSGFEFSISSLNVSTGDFSWSTSFNISTNKNEITDLNGQNAIVGVNAFLEGQASGVFYTRRYVGVDPGNGQALYDNGVGGTTTDWESAPRMVIGDPNPDFFGGLTNNVFYKGLELDFLFQFVQGVDIYNATGEFLSNSGILNLGQTANQVNRWYAPGDNAPFPVMNPFQENTNPSSRFLEDGSYIRLKTLTLTYNFPSEIVSNWGLSYFKFYIGGQNLLTFTDYSGYDPDVNYIDPNFGTIERNISRGIDNFTAPQARTIISGIKIGF
ncbi:MAG: TonB-dependent receptor [Cytophagales bacterium]|nr:TonB-dependent receptor [Cytophagales bacterium]